MKVAIDGYVFKHSTRGMVRFAKVLTGDLGARALILEPAGSMDLEFHDHGSGKRPNFPYWEQWILPRLARDAGADMLLCPYNTGPLRLPAKIRMILVIHDLIFMDKSIEASTSRIQNIGRHYRRAVVPLVARRAFHIVTVSEYSKQGIIANLGIPEAKITVIPNAVGEFWFQSVERSRSDRPYILTVSGEAPSKNLSRLIEAFARTHRTRPEARLVVAGVRPAAHHHFQRLARTLGVEDDVTLISFRSDEELRSLYQNADLYVCASLSEGFGIPILEAMASGVPLACSKTTSIPEVCGDAAWYFDPRDSRSISSTLTDLLTQSNVARSRIQQGKSRASEFTERNVAIKVQEFWRRVSEDLVL
jgi:glycosyltransferase involved in cell wall biosynthesis